MLSNNDGNVISRSNEAKELGITMGAPFFKIKEVVEAKGVKVFSSNYELYGDISARVMEVLSELVPEVEVYSIDEAFLDLSILPDQELEAYAHELRIKVKQWTGIPVSIGIGATKTLAKAASKIAKKREGVFIMSDLIKNINTLEEIAIEEVWGIGQKYAKFLRDHCITTALDLRNAKPNFIAQHLTVVGKRLVMELRGFRCLSLEIEPPPKQAICVSRSSDPGP